MAKVMIEGRLAFPQLFVAKEQKNDDGTTRYVFQATVLLDPSGPSVAAVKAAQRQAAIDTWGAAKADEVLNALASKDKVCLHDGAEKALKYEGFGGMLYVSANSKVRPLVLDANKSPLTEKDGKPYAGCYVKAQIDVYGQKDHPKGGNRINAQLMGVQFVKDGDSFGGGRASNPDDFADVSTTAGAASPWDGKKAAGSDLV